MKSSLFACLLFIFAAAFAAASEVRWMWSGAAAPESVRIKVKYESESAPALRIGRDAALGDAREVAPASVTRAGDGWVADYRVSGLAADTVYHYAAGATPGKVRTLPAGPASFTIALGACSETGSAHPVFLTIARHNPLLFLQMGDLHYEDIAVNDVNAFHAAYDAAPASATQSVLFRSTAVIYMWDDHDFGPNNSDSSSPSREASRRAYREAVPHYPLVVEEDGPIYHAFTVGRVRFIMADARSERSPRDVPEGLARSMLGAEQKAWLMQEMLAARDTHALIVWVNTVPWIGNDTASENEDRWTGFVTERAELAGFIETHGIRNLCMVSGDAHMLAIDDGSNNRYGPSGEPGFPVFHAAALDRKGSVKGGPYSHGTFPGPGQFGLMSVIDDGGPEVVVEWSGLNHEEKELLTHRFTVTAPSPAKQ